jgi:hypothetical protein
MQIVRIEPKLALKHYLNSGSIKKSALVFYVPMDLFNTVASTPYMYIIYAFIYLKIAAPLLAMAAKYRLRYQRRHEGGAVPQMQNKYLNV